MGWGYPIPYYLLHNIIIKLNYSSDLMSKRTDDISIDGTYGAMTFKDGVATFMTRHGESKTATDLPNGVMYTVQKQITQRTVM